MHQTIEFLVHKKLIEHEGFAYMSYADYNQIVDDWSQFLEDTYTYSHGDKSLRTLVGESLFWINCLVATLTDTPPVVVSSVASSSAPVSP